MKCHVANCEMRARASFTAGLHLCRFHLWQLRKALEVMGDLEDWMTVFSGRLKKGVSICEET